MALETAFAIDTSSIKYGPGVTQEVGFDMRSLGCQRVMVVTDVEMASSDSVITTLSSLRKESVDAVLFDRVRIEPTDGSLKAAINVASEGMFDGFVAVGGGSSIDTAKVANLYSTYPAEFLTYVNQPIGLGRPVPGPLKPLAAIPTTTGTGSETTGVAIFDLEEMHAKTGISHRRLRPTIGLVDPENTKTLPGMVVACSGLDVLCHGLESFTALPFSQRLKSDNPGMRPSYQGSNPISDVWSLKAIEMVSKNIERAVNDPGDYKARSNMLLAATFAGVGFGNAGCHLPHGMSYPVSGMVREYIPDGYPKDHPIIPHGMSVALNAPAVFRFTAPSNLERHLQAAKVLGTDAWKASLDDAGDILSAEIITIMKKIHMPNGLNSVGFNNNDGPSLAKGTLPQHRVTKLSPREANENDLSQLFVESMKLW